MAEQLAFQEKLRENEREWHESAAAGGPAGSDFVACSAEADAARKSAEQALATARARQERAREAMRGIGDDYHPVDLKTGARLEPDEVGRKLAQRFDEAEAIAEEAGLAERSLKSIEKARRLVPAFVRTLLFFSLETASRIAGLGLAPDQRRAIDQYLLPLAYLECVVRKARDAAARQRLRDLIAHLRACPPAIATSLAILSPELQTQVPKTVAECATIFQRASSCTEGRNGQLSLYHHGLHHLSDRKLRVLTVLHNYFILRPDGTTAAERFFGTQPPDLFEWLLGRVATPARPARPRSHRTGRVAKPRRDPRERPCRSFRAVLDLQAPHRLRRAIEIGEVREHDQRPVAARRVDAPPAGRRTEVLTSTGPLGRRNGEPVDVDPVGRRKRRRAGT